MGAVLQPPPPGISTSNLGWLLAQASYVIKTQLTSALEEVGISPRAFHVLMTANTGEYTQTELAQQIGLDKTTMTVTMDHLEAAGLAERLPSSTDRRARVIAVTKDGRKKLAQAEAIVDKVNEDVLAALPAKERKAFVDSLCRLVGDRLSEPSPCSQPVRRRG
jgi:DNA-binding MarR family transcriptional regulator